MPSGRRPPPPPPKDNSDPSPPPLPFRPGSTANKQVELIHPVLPTRSLPVLPTSAKKFQETPSEQDDDGMYEQPTPQSISAICSAASVGDINSFSAFARMSAAEDSDSDGWPESEWDEFDNLDVSSTPQSENTYLIPEGWNSHGDYNMPDDSHEATKKINKQTINSRVLQVVGTDHSTVLSPVTSSKLAAVLTAHGSREDKKNKVEIKSFESSRPNPPPNKPNMMDQHKPVPKPKPPVKPSDPLLPKLPPRPIEKSKPTLPSVPPLGSKIDAMSGDNAGAGSVSSESVICPSDPERGITEKRSTNRGQDKLVNQNVNDAPIYDDGVSEVLPRFDWFHGELDRDEGAKMVKQLSENGAFLIRASKSDGTNNSHPYTLVVTLDNKVYNLKIRLRNDKRFAIGTYKPDEVSFSTVPELVDHHKANNIKLTEGGAVKLMHTPKK